MYFSLFKFTNSFISRSFLNNISPLKLRKYLHEELQSKHKYLTYPNAKSIFHEKISFIDIYGDNEQERNIEHVFPQFLFKNDVNKKFMKSDLHNLYLCNSKLNSFRQNFTYVDSKDSKHLLNANTCILDKKAQPIDDIEKLFEKQGYFMIFDKKKQIFLPTPQSRGKIARSLAYFAVRYNYIDILPKIINLETLLAWNYLDPVDNEEYLKNIICYKYQNNFNPFILDSDLITYCFSDKVEIENHFFLQKHINYIDPLYSIEYLLKELNNIEKSYETENKSINKIINNRNKDKKANKKK